MRITREAIMRELFVDAVSLAVVVLLIAIF